jgi:choice-of-anchor C domain-containing protein
MLTRWIGAVVGLAVAGIVTSAGAVTLINGSFELGINPPTDSSRTISSGSSDITGWAVVDGSVDWISAPITPDTAFTIWQPSDGSFSLDLSGSGAGTIQQTIAGLDVGATYQISFDMSGNGKGGDVIKDLIATVITDNTFSFDTSECCGGESGATDFSNMQWVTYSFIFIATDTTELLKFRSLEGNPYGPALDNVSISFVAATAPIPLPAAFPLFATALGGLGLMGWRKRCRAKRLINPFQAVS